MTGYIPNDHPDFTLFRFSDLQVIIIIPAGPIAILTSPGKIQSGHLRICFGYEILLDFFGEIQWLTHLISLLESPGHFVDNIPGITDFIIGSDPHFLVKVSITYRLQSPDDILKRLPQIETHQNR